MKSFEHSYSVHIQVHQLVQKFDEHSVAKQHKFGVIYQKFGQVRHVCCGVSKHTSTATYDACYRVFVCLIIMVNIVDD